MTQVKICGLSTPETVEASIAAGADFIGLNFYPPSPRYVSLEQASKLADLARGRVKIVALVVDADDALLREIVARVDPDFVQAHGSETPQRISEIAWLTVKPVIKAIRVRDAADIAAAADYAAVAAFILYDSRAPETLATALPGGTGHAFDWTLLGGEKRPAFMLAGGLTTANVAEAIRTTGAPIVDLSSGVESAPGVKDPAMIRNFIEAVRAAR
jgi:phosphoribosylanthranilate isomerase